MTALTWKLISHGPLPRHPAILHKVTSTQPSFTETPSIQSSFAKTPSIQPSFAGLPIAHSSMADKSDPSMPSFDTSYVSSLLDGTNLASFQVPNISAENSIDDSLLVAADPAELTPIEYCIIPGGTKHGNDMLTVMASPIPGSPQREVLQVTPYTGHVLFATKISSVQP